MKVVVALAALLVVAVAQDSFQGLATMIHNEVHSLVAMQPGLTIDECETKCDNLFDFVEHHDEMATDIMCSQSCACVVANLCMNQDPGTIAPTTNLPQTTTQTTKLPQTTTQTTKLPQTTTQTTTLPPPPSPTTNHPHTHHPTNHPTNHATNHPTNHATNHPTHHPPHHGK